MMTKLTMAFVPAQTQEPRPRPRPRSLKIWKKPAGTGPYWSPEEECPIKHVVWQKRPVF